MKNELQQNKDFELSVSEKEIKEILETNDIKKLEDLVGVLLEDKAYYDADGNLSRVINNMEPDGTMWYDDFFDDPEIQEKYRDHDLDQLLDDNTDEEPELMEKYQLMELLDEEDTEKYIQYIKDYIGWLVDRLHDEDE